MTASQPALLTVQHVSTNLHSCHGLCQYTKEQTHVSFSAAGEMVFTSAIQVEKTVDVIKVVCPPGSKGDNTSVVLVETHLVTIFRLGQTIRDHLLPSCIRGEEQLGHSLPLS